MRARRPETPKSRLWRLIAAGMLALALLGHVPAAFAVSTQGRVSIAVSLPGTLQTSTYTIGNFRVANRETVTGYTITFPSDTDVSGITSRGAGDTVVQLGGNSVRVNLGTPLPQRTTFSIVLDNVVNPTTPGAYSITQAVFHVAGGPDQTVTWQASQGTYTILATPYITLTITTPGPGQTVDFGAVDPGVTTSSIEVTVTVLSSSPFTLTRTLGGDAVALGLDVGAPLAESGPIGTTTYVDSYRLTPPWTTDPGVDMVATVTYTVVQ